MLVLSRVSHGESEGRFRDDMEDEGDGRKATNADKKLHVERDVGGNTLPPSVV